MSYLRLNDDCFLKLLESPYVYNVKKDELYEVNDKAIGFLMKCNGITLNLESEAEPEFLSYCFSENILEELEEPKERKIYANKAPEPSLRYLELQITNKCNLICRHCYLGEAGKTDLDYETAIKIFDEFEKMQGLRLLITGGEPILHKRFWGINVRLPEFGFRSILLSNGTLITKGIAERLNVHEVQVSLDGMENGHDTIRGKGSFRKALSGIDALKSAGIDVSIATMIHSKNIEEFENLNKLIEKMAIVEWNVDVPCSSGYLLNNKELLLPYSEAAQYMHNGFGGGSHGSANKFVCGSHLCAVTPLGKVIRCGFYPEAPLGDVREGLRTCWERMQHIKLTELDCDCEFINECKGGCRYRAELYKDVYAPDPVQCYARGVELTAS